MTDVVREWFCFGGWLGFIVGFAIAMLLRDLRDRVSK